MRKSGKGECEMKGRVFEVCLGRRGGSSYGEGVKGMRSCCPIIFQILGPPGIGFYICIYILNDRNLTESTIEPLNVRTSAILNCRSCESSSLKSESFAGKIQFENIH